MKKYPLLILLCFIIGKCYCQTGVSFKWNLQYVQTNRPAMQPYFEDLSDSMHLNSVLNIKGGFGFGAGILFTGEHTEGEWCGTYTRSADEIGDKSDNLLHYINSDIAICMGVNYLPVNFFLIGGSFVINSSTGQSNETCEGSGDRYLELLPSKDFHIFRGYGVALKAQSGFYININKDDFNRMRLTGYYTYGLSQYNFYTVSEKRLSGYEGNQKTNFQVAGVELAFMFGM